ncbi:hypothetical protein [Ruminococcus sp.]|nr:hypothetical protein [Ruminococcus sp.]
MSEKISSDFLLLQDTVGSSIAAAINKDIGFKSILYISKAPPLLA